MLEGLYLTRNGTFRKGGAGYIYKEACAKCGQPYLVQKRECISSFCTVSCATSGKNNPFFGKIHTVKARKKMSENTSDYTGFLNPNYRGDKAGFAKYDVYKKILGIYEEVRKQKGTDLLEVRCAYCNCWYVPTYKSVSHRLDVINKLNQGESRLYCSENCKQACPTYGKKVYPKGFKHTTSREVSTYLRQMVLERDNWTCQICGKTVKEAQLHCHHMDPVAQNQMFQNDIDSCITFCKDYHKMVHSRRGCRYIDLQCGKE